MLRMESAYKDQEANSGHYIPAQYSVGNLFKAANDMLVRIEENAGSVYTPNHKLTQKEMTYVLQGFLRGTNDLTVNAVNKFFDRNTRYGGILSGGSVYTEMVRKVTEKYAESLPGDSFVVAVDKDNKSSVFETSKSDDGSKTVILLDDIIDGGGTMLTALWSAGKYFPNATIYSGKEVDYPGGFKQRSTKKHMDYLELLFQDFADLSGDGKLNEALVIFQQAESYAQKNNVQLRPGWYMRKKRLKIG